MMHRKTLAAALLAATSVMGLGTAAQAAPAVVAVESAPPAPVYERIPAPREGYVWAPGHYDWRNGQYVWVSGHWLEARAGWEYRQPEWVQRSDGSWYLTAGEWVRNGSYAYNRWGDDDRAQRRWERRFGPNGDLDRDGVLNQDDSDRDGDGVRNRYDRYPNDPDRD